MPSPATARIRCALLVSRAAAVGLTRVYLGMHRPADVLGGRLFTHTSLAAAMARCAATGQAEAIVRRVARPRSG